jgi:type I restriction enzyme, R subunit
MEPDLIPENWMMQAYRPDSEDALEQAAIDLFTKLDWTAKNCYHEFARGDSFLGRQSMNEVVLASKLRPVMENLKANKDLPAEAFDLAIEELTRGRSAMSMAAANREVFKLLKEGVKVTIKDEDGDESVETVQVIDWNNLKNNDFFLASQFWVSGELYKKRADLVGFVNGIPLLFVELKSSHRRYEDAYNKNLNDYKKTIPHLFWYNAFIILSNGSFSKIGSITAPLEHFNDWKRINTEGEKGVISLDTMVRGTCDPKRFLDLAENFAFFYEEKGGLVKITAKNHQYLGVNNSIKAFKNIKKNQGRLGVFWHTTGSGKSFSMIFFTQKVLRKESGNYTFVVVTDRISLDDQIYKNFVDSGAVIEEDVKAKDGEHLKQLRKEDHRVVFTIINKFHTKRGQKYPILSDRSDVIVITDEAHRTQYDLFARNMRNALPKAAFIGFTATPLMEGEERTRQVFGDYVSIYNYKESTEDKATVPIFYENRIPELQLTNDNLNEDLYNVVEEVDLDEAQEKKLQREFKREYHLITRKDRLDRIASDVVAHFMGRGYHGKAMMVCIDRFTAIKMYDKVSVEWKKYIKTLKSSLKKAPDYEIESIKAKIKFMEKTDIAVVISSSQNEQDDFAKHGLDILPHRKRMVKEDLDTKFKDPADPFRLVFVCAMWTAGFDAPSCSTIYLDKPMKNHTLMQTMNRANRVFGEKLNGLIVDYLGVFREVKKALAIYGSGIGGKSKEGESPIGPKTELVNQLRKSIAETVEFCQEKGFDLEKLKSVEGFEWIKLRDDAVDLVIKTDESKFKYIALSNVVRQLFKAILPDAAADDFGPMCYIIRNLAEKIRSLMPEVDISIVQDNIEKILDDSIAPSGYVIKPPTHEESTEHLIDLSKINFDTLRKEFVKGRKHIEAEKLRGSINAKLRRMMRLNKTRIDFYEEFQKMIVDYNSECFSVEEFFKQLVNFAQKLNEEDQRSIKENLEEEELAVFDLLLKPDLKLSKKEEKQVKKVAQDLLDSLKQEKLVLDWRKRQQTRAVVKVTIQDVLDQLPEKYTEEIYNEKCVVLFQHVFDSYYGEGRSVYSQAG